MSIDFLLLSRLKDFILLTNKNYLKMLQKHAIMQKRCIFAWFIKFFHGICMMMENQYVNLIARYVQLIKRNFSSENLFLFSLKNSVLFSLKNFIEQVYTTICNSFLWILYYVLYLRNNGKLNEKNTVSRFASVWVKSYRNYTIHLHLSKL